MSPWLLTLLAMACRTPEPAEGIAVGNPPGATMTMRLAPSSDMRLSAEPVQLAPLRLEGCDGELALVPVQDPQPLDGSASIELPAGTWCSLTLSAGPLVIQGEGGSGETFRFESTLSPVLLTGALTLAEEERPLLLELGKPDWVNVTALGLAPGEHQDLGADCAAQPGCQAMTLALTKESALYDDDDGSGDLSDEERSAGAVAEGEGREDEPEDTGEDDTGHDTGEDDTGHDTGEDDTGDTDSEDTESESSEEE